MAEKPKRTTQQKIIGALAAVALLAVYFLVIKPALF